MASAQTASTCNLKEKALCHSLLLWACFQKALERLLLSALDNPVLAYNSL